MSWPDRRVAIETHLKDALASSYPNIPVGYDNQEFKPPSEKTWVRITITDFLTQHASLGQPCVKTDGFATMQIFTPRGAGPQEADEIAAFIAALFRGVRLSDETDFFDVTILANVGLEGTAWYQTNVSAQYLSYDR